jgi:acetyl-CoA synthetase
VLITADGNYRGAKPIELKKIADEAVAETPGIEKVVVVRQMGKEVPMKQGRDIYLDELLQDVSADTVVPCEPMDSEDMLYILYTSGSTGKPKGVVHVQGGYSVGVYATTKFVFDIKPNDVFWCTADVGWVTGHSYTIYGPLMNGATSILFEGIPTYPAADRFWSIVEKYKGTIIYTAPTANGSALTVRQGRQAVFARSVLAFDCRWERPHRCSYDEARRLWQACTLRQRAGSCAGRDTARQKRKGRTQMVHLTLL